MKKTVWLVLMCCMTHACTNSAQSGEEVDEEQLHQAILAIQAYQAQESEDRLVLYNEATGARATYAQLMALHRSNLLCELGRLTEQESMELFVNNLRNHAIAEKKASAVLGWSVQDDGVRLRVDTLRMYAEVVITNPASEVFAEYLDAFGGLEICDPDNP